MPSARGQAERYCLLDAVRGFAILWIVVFHLLSSHAAAYPGFFRLLIQNGGLGVPIFFILSGFSISTAAAKVLSGQQSVRSFLMKRLRRVMIPYWFSVLFAAVVIPWCCWVLCRVWGLDPAEYFVSYSPAEWAGILSLTKIFVPIEKALNHAFLPLNGPVWFIAVLVQMYFVIAVALLKPRWYWKILGCVTLVWGISLVPGVHERLPYGVFLSSWGEFAAGIVLYRLDKEGKPLVRGLTALSLAVLLISFFSRPLFALFFTALLWALRPYDRFWARGSLYRAGLFLGGFSYSLYLMHMPLDNLMSLIFGKMLPQMPVPILDPLLVIPAILLASYVWARLFEGNSEKKNLMKA